MSTANECTIMTYIMHNLKQRLIDESDAIRKAEQRVESVVKQAY